MIKAGQGIYTNFQYKPTDQNQQVIAMVLGPPGVGKSRLVNNICGSSHQVGIQRGSLTNKLQFEQCRYIDAAQFYICDGPGMDDTYMKVLLKALVYNQWNVLFVQSKISARFQIDCLPYLVNTCRMFKSGTERIVFLVSHTDDLDVLDKQKPGQKDNILRLFHDSLVTNQIKNNVIMYSNQNSDFKKLSQVLYSCGCGIGKQKNKFQLKPRFLKGLDESDSNELLKLPPPRQKSDTQNLKEEHTASQSTTIQSHVKEQDTMFQSNVKEQSTKFPSNNNLVQNIQLDLPSPKINDNINMNIFIFSQAYGNINNLIPKFYMACTGIPGIIYFQLINKMIQHISNKPTASYNIISTIKPDIKKSQHRNYLNTIWKGFLDFIMNN